MPANSESTSPDARPIIIAIDGPSASGKSTVAREVAQRLDFNYVDSGSLYRGLTWKVLHEKIDPDDEAGILISMDAGDWEFHVADQAVVFTIDERSPGLALREPQIHENVSKVARVQAVREFINRHLRQMTRFGSLVVEGRDIGSVVFPETPYKFYLDADPVERARRRQAELVKADVSTGVDEVQSSLERRDEMDSNRETAPLQIALGATVINSTDLNVDDVVQVIIDQVMAG